MDSLLKGKLPVRYVLPDLPIDISPNPALEGRRMTGMDITEGLQELAMNDGPKNRAINPATSTSVPIDRPMRSRQLSSGVIRTPRPKLRRKAATAPPGALCLDSSTPQPPRRAISARVSRQSQSQSRSKGDLPSGLWITPLPRVFVYGIPASRSLIGKEKSNRKSVGRLALKPRKSVWRVLPPTTSKNYHLISQAFDNRKTSFSEKTRMKELLTNKKVEFLKTNVKDLDALDLPNTPNTPGSMTNTPKEMYGTSAEDASFLSHPEPGKRRLLPIDSVNHLSIHLSPNIQRFDFVARSNSELTVRNAKVQSTAFNQQVYLPGSIRLEERISETPRKESIATLESPTSKTGETNNDLDLVALDGIVAYFRSLGVLDKVGEDGLDKYWEPERQTNRIVPIPRRPTAAPHVPTRTLLLAAPSSGSAMIFPVNVVQQQEERQPLSSLNLRQRIRLRRFLNSATSML
jgi:hypothetical protein